VSAIYKTPTSNNIQLTLNSNYTAGGSTLVLSQDVSSTVQAPGVVCVDRVDTNGGKTPTKRTYYYFTGVSTSTLTGVSTADGTDQAHAVGAIVEFTPDVKWAQSLYDALVNVVVAGTGAVDTTKVVTPAGSQTLTNKTIASFLQGVGNTITVPAVSDTLVGKATTDTLTNKRITQRIVTTTDDATAVIDVDVTDQYQLTAVANDTVFTVTGTPTAGQKLIVRLKDAGVAKNLTWTGFTARGATPPAVTVANKTHYVGFIYNATASTWDCVAAIVEA
jgi:hypothetical protein